MLKYIYQGKKDLRLWYVDAGVLLVGTWKAGGYWCVWTNITKLLPSCFFVMLWPAYVFLDGFQVRYWSWIQATRPHQIINPCWRKLKFLSQWVNISLDDAPLASFCKHYCIPAKQKENSPHMINTFSSLYGSLRNMELIIKKSLACCFPICLIRQKRMDAKFHLSSLQFDWSVSLAYSSHCTYQVKTCVLVGDALRWCVKCAD